MRPTLPSALLLAALLLAACGQKGPLYRADETAQEVSAPGTAPGTESGKKKTPIFPPAPQSQKNPSPPVQTPTPTDPTPAPPAVDPDRPATPPPGR
ncbi:LPS translocon maturation chaperone LptM [Povalibacter uvarum]|uniref:LPS translocon maturation chaperone LptM n=1 Tax=Povalibacter uvarum TaxID=732238 RepID=UPI0016125B2B